MELTPKQAIHFQILENNLASLTCEKFRRLNSSINPFLYLAEITIQSKNDNNMIRGHDHNH